MTRSDLREMSTNFYIASTILAEKLADGSCGLLVKPAICEIDSNEINRVVSCIDDDGMHIQFSYADGKAHGEVKGEYCKGDIIYVRESYFLENGVPMYVCDNRERAYFEKKYVISARYMRKIYARTFLRIENVRFMRLHDLSFEDIHRAGYRSFEQFFRQYDSDLTERQDELCSSERNPYVFVYDVRKLSEHEF